MKSRTYAFALAGATALLTGLVLPLQAQEEAPGMSFFITSTGLGDGANLGGLEGADAHCQALAGAAGAEGDWVAYLSTQGEGAVNARDRIGTGPWFNAEGVQIASDLAALHGENAIDKETALNERGEQVNGRGDDPNQHDILTGSQADGTAFEGAEDRTCGNWTSSDDGSAFVGHHDLIGNPNINLWNHSHGSRGCSQQALEGTGGAGLFYCFAVTGN